MKEADARTIIQVMAIERAGGFLTDEQRSIATQSARSSLPRPGTTLTRSEWSERFLLARATRLLEEALVASPRLGVFVRGSRAKLAVLLAWAVPLSAFALGVLADRVPEVHRIDIVSVPLLLIVAWNWVVFAALVPLTLLASFRRRRGRHGSPARFLGLFHALPVRRGGRLGEAISVYTAAWSRASAGLLGARVARTLHLSAAMLVAGALLSISLKGVTREFQVGWESQWLRSPEQVRDLLAVVFFPVTCCVDQQASFTVDEISRMEHWAAGGKELGTRWFLLYASVLLLTVALPRGVLALLAHWRARRLARRISLDLDDPYFARLLGGADGAVAMLRVWPYACSPEPARLERVARDRWGPAARLRLEQKTGYGERAPEAVAREAGEAGIGTVMHAVVFAVAATPEREVHGEFVVALRRALQREVWLLVDRSGGSPGKLGGAHFAERLRERELAWRQFAQSVGAKLDFLDGGG
ncbi:MAG: DUF2868 domain-containing protein [Burkholderiaceae bacterium]